ncbi:hypothetical protein BaRGS_00017648 [Batillaria attramentaria]|uniref:Uncharacterized protein n=1 Tax=Batillaria attramentaria TaxID=370345 RepID=A0ABD0KV42_9CAEN
MASSHASTRKLSIQKTVPLAARSSPPPLSQPLSPPPPPHSHRNRVSMETVLAAQALGDFGKRTDLAQNAGNCRRLCDTSFEKPSVSGHGHFLVSSFENL